MQNVKFWGFELNIFPLYVYFEVITHKLFMLYYNESPKSQMFKIDIFYKI
jgi:hypothetical protein